MSIQHESVGWISIPHRHERRCSLRSIFHLPLHNNGMVPDSKVHGDNMGPTWVLSVPDGPHEPCYHGCSDTTMTPCLIIWKSLIMEPCFCLSNNKTGKYIHYLNQWPRYVWIMSWIRPLVVILSVLLWPHENVQYVKDILYLCFGVHIATLMDI